MKIPQDYFERVYAGWLGKIIGIRLGAPIEMWRDSTIKAVYGELDGYPLDYKNFAADDDSNGPLFFIRALEDCEDITRFSAEDVGKAVLNYVPVEHSFFWWGGYGFSTEHTAYLNLRNGISAPRSGSVEQNGAQVAEQIGGQIFIDPWGLVAPGNPRLAADLASKAASATHGGNGIYGGIFIACCISLAFVERDIRTIIDKALAYIPKDCEYAKVVKAVIRFHDEHPDNWHSCCQYVYENYTRDKYPGVCHIIPNSGFIVLSLLYGGGDFSRTVNICNMCGWDTDCNVGNVGCIMGVLCGVEGIDHRKYAAPINDFLAASGAVPSLNVTDLPYGASYFARMAYRLAGEEVPEKWRDILENRIDSCHFEYPTSTHAIRGRCPGGYHIRNTDEAAHSGSRSLRITALSANTGVECFFYKQTYYGPEDFDDSRYDPFFAPLVYPGQTMHVSVLLGPEDEGVVPCAQPYVKLGRSGEILRGERVFGDGWKELSLTIPSGLDDYVQETGVILVGESPRPACAILTAFLDDLYCSGTPDYRIDFAKETVEQWTEKHREVSQFGRLKGSADLGGDALALSCEDFGEVYTGHIGWKDYTFEGSLTPESGRNCYLNIRVQGGMRSYAAGFAGDKLVLDKNLYGYQTLCETPFSWETGMEYHLRLTAVGNRITVCVNGKKLLDYTDDDAPFLIGSVGLSVRDNSRCSYRNLAITGT